MNLYNQYSYNTAFCAFRKIVSETITNYLKDHHDISDTLLCISKYLEIRIVTKEGLNTSEDLLDVLNVSDFVRLNNQTKTIDYNRIDELVVKYIIEPSKKTETKWEVLNSRMIRDYENRIFPNDIFGPYIKWKKSEISSDDISIEQIDKMSEEAERLLEFYESKYPQANLIHDMFTVDDPWQFTRGYGDDKYIVAYLQYISDQLSDLHLRNWYR